MLTIVLAVAIGASAADTLPPAPVRLAGSPGVVSAARLSPVERAESRPPDFLADSMVLDKSDRRLTLFHQGRRVREYVVALGRVPVGPKQRRGDGKTPEGLYYIEGRNPRSKFHLSLRVSYPTAEQRALAAQRGISPGGDIMIHGLPPAFASVGTQHRNIDWTEGCVAVTNEEIEEIWRSVSDGAWILIQP